MSKNSKRPLPNRIDESCYRVGIVLPYLKSRGTENQALGLAVGLSNRGASVTVFVVQGWGKEEVYERFRLSGANVIDVGQPLYEGEKRVSLFRFLALARLARKHGCDVLFSRAGMTNRVTGLAGKFSRIPVLASMSGSIRQAPETSDGFIPNALAYLKTVRWKRHLGYPSRIVCVSEEGAKNLAGRYHSARNLITSVRNGVDIDRVRTNAVEDPGVQLPTDRFLIGFSGSIEINRKGFDTLIDGIARVAEKESAPLTLVVVVGSGEDEQAVKERIRELGLAEYFLFVGDTEYPHAYIPRCELFVLPSRREGLPNALLEAMALGVCSVAADCDTGPREVIRDGETGFLFPVGDSDMLAGLILRLKNDDALRLSIAKNGEAAVFTEFTHERMVEQYDLLLRQTARKHPSGY